MVLAGAKAVNLWTIKQQMNYIGAPTLIGRLPTSIFNPMKTYYYKTGIVTVRTFTKENERGKAEVHFWVWTRGNLTAHTSSSPLLAASHPPRRRPRSAADVNQRR